jgi:hypothetical protein
MIDNQLLLNPIKKECPEIVAENVRKMFICLEYVRNIAIFRTLENFHFPENVQKMSRRVQTQRPESVRNIAIFWTFSGHTDIFRMFLATISGHFFFYRVVIHHTSG